MRNLYLSKTISEMTRVDQGARKQGLSSAGKMGIPNFLIYAIDAVHNYRILNVIKQYGYPSHATLGAKGMRDFWLLIQHQDFDIELQKQCLEKCDFKPKERAFLTDRILVNQNKKQLYGTQFHRKGEKLVPYPIHEQKNLEERRKKADLGPFQEYKKIILLNHRSLTKEKKKR